jgi:hypothetical protein
VAPSKWGRNDEIWLDKNHDDVRNDTLLRTLLTFRLLMPKDAQQEFAQPHFFVKKMCVRASVMGGGNVDATVDTRMDFIE